jgi:hypothetical protein
MTIFQETSNSPLLKLSNTKLISKEDSKLSREIWNLVTTTLHSLLSDLSIDTTVEELTPLMPDHSLDNKDITHQRWNFLLSLEEWILMVMQFSSTLSLLSSLDQLAQLQEEDHPQQDHHQLELHLQTDQATHLH